LRQIRHVALDMDGTLYHGNSLFPATLPFLDLLKQLEIGRTFLTNNSSKSTHDYVAHLDRFGINAAEDEIFTSTQATLDYFQSKMPHVRRLFLLGTDSLREEIVSAGFTIAEDDAADEPDAVLVGFDTGLIYSRLCRAAYWIKAGKPFVATHSDRVCPTDQPTVLLDCGSICAALQCAAGRPPDAVLGKPDPAIVSGILQRHHLKPEGIAVVGDRLYTDMAMARQAGVLGVLVLTGEATVQQASSAEPPPDLIVSDLRELGERLKLSRRCD
jgi:NagD protein